MSLTWCCYVKMFRYVTSKVGKILTHSPVAVIILRDINIQHQPGLSSSFTDQPDEQVFHFATLSNQEQLLQHPRERIILLEMKYLWTVTEVRRFNVTNNKDVWKPAQLANEGIQGNAEVIQSRKWKVEGKTRKDHIISTYSLVNTYFLVRSKSKADDRPPLRKYLLEGNFYLGAVIANTLVKLAFR